MAMSRLWNQQLAGKLAKKTSTLDERIKFLDFLFLKGLSFWPKNPKLGCKKLADIYKIGKPAAANILKNERKLREQHEMFCENQRNVTAMVSTTR